MCFTEVLDSLLSESSLFDKGSKMKLPQNKRESRRNLSTFNNFLSGISLRSSLYFLVLITYLVVLGFSFSKGAHKIFADDAVCSDLANLSTELTINSSDYSGAGYVLDCSSTDISIASGGRLVVVPDLCADDSVVTDDQILEIHAQSFTVADGGEVNLTGQGYAAGEQVNHTGSGKSSIEVCGDCVGHSEFTNKTDCETAGHTWQVGTCGGSGAGHGGAGGKGNPDVSNEAGQAGGSYGDQSSPITLGSGGGVSATGALGGAGGGGLKLVVSGAFLNNGSISADGEDGSLVDDSGGGGGAGGSIWIDADTVDGSGTVTALGGDGGSGSKSGGGGGGGRVVMSCHSGNTYTGSVSVNPGTGGIQDGQVGTLVGPSCYPVDPTSLSQEDSSGVVDDEGGTHNSSITIKFTMSDVEDTSYLYPQVELREVGQTFTGVATHTGDSVFYEGSPVEGSVSIGGLVKNAEYKWRARIRDEDGTFSDWVEFGGVSDDELDIFRYGDPAQLIKVSGDGQSDTVGSTLSSPFVVQALDAASHPIPDISVSWDLKSGGGSLDSSSSTTDSNGESQVSLTLGTTSGENIVDAILSGASGSPMSFNATGVADSLDHYYVNVDSVALVSDSFSLTVEARDQHENIVESNNDTVNLTDVLSSDGVTDGSGSLSVSQVTLVDGISNISNQTYDTEESIKIKATNGGTEGLSNTIQILSSFGSCPVAGTDPVIDTDVTWNAGDYPNGVVDCSGKNITVKGNTLTLSSYDSGDEDWTNDYGLTLLADNLTLSYGCSDPAYSDEPTCTGAGGTWQSGNISSTGEGYGDLVYGTGHRGPGGGGGTSGDGGAHGGYAQSNSDEPYGDVYEPTDLGSRGGDKNYWGSHGIGGPGGGAIKLSISGVLDLGDGSIVSDGAVGTKTGSAGGGGGSGGSIWIETDTIQGSNGLITVNGAYGRSSHVSGYDGSGGRISINYSTNVDFSFDTDHIQARGQNASAPGTVYISNGTASEIYVDNNGYNTKHAGIVEDEYSFSKISLTRHGHLDIMGQNSVLTVTDGGALTGDSTMPDLTMEGTFEYTGGSTLYINNIDVGVNGDITGVNDVTIGNSGNGGLTLYAHTWAKSGNYTFGDMHVGANGVVTLVSYDNGDSDWSNDYGTTLNLQNLTIGSCSDSLYTTKSNCETNGETWGGGVLTSTAQGYGGGRGTSHGGPGANNNDSGDGGAYGGYGDSNSDVPYGNIYEPTDLGSRGAHRRYNSGNYGVGGEGGGAVKILVSDTLDNEGELSSDGSIGHSVGSSGGGGGSGGSLWIETVNLSGDNGLITANGGNGKGGFRSNQRGYGGAGGRIALYYETDSSQILNGFGTSSQKIQSYGGDSATGGGTGGPGTIYIEQTVGGVKNYDGDLYVDNDGNNYHSAGIVEDSYVFNKLSLTRYGHLDVMGDGSYLTIADGSALVGDSTMPDLTVEGTFNYSGSGALEINNVDVGINGDITGVDDIILGDSGNGGITLYASTWARNEEYQYNFGDVTVGPYGNMTLVGNDNEDSDWSNDYGVKLTLDNLSVEAACSNPIYSDESSCETNGETWNKGIITSDGWGYRGGYGSTHRGPGGGSGTSKDGGSYGGFGGSNAYEPYGNVYEPTFLGSRGGDCHDWDNSMAGGAGGGSIELDISGMLNVDGEIKSNGSVGQSGSRCGAGGGTGGSILIEASTISGDGSIESNGGNGSGEGHGGSGGRISIYYQNDSSSIISSLGSSAPKIRAFGGHQGINNTTAGAGTIYIEQTLGSKSYTGDLYIDNNNEDDLSAGLIEGNYVFNKIYLTRYGHLDVLGEGTACSDDQFLTKQECETGDGTWDGGGRLTVTDASGLEGDSTMPNLTVFGTFSGPSSLSIDGVDVGLRGEVEMGSDTSSSELRIGESSEGGLILYANTWAHNEDYQYEFGDIVVGGNGSLSLISSDNADSDWSNDYGVELALNNLSIDSGGEVTADAYGYNGGYGSSHSGPGGGVGNSGDGGSYGGYGDSNSLDPYGDVYEPAHLGSRGADRYYNSGNRGVGGEGGGAIKLLIANTLDVEGSISSDGSIGHSIGSSGGGGGSGGSIWIETKTLTGDAGVITAKGGNGKSGFRSDQSGYAGSGGRISIYYENSTSQILEDFGTVDQSIQAYGGNSATGGGTGGPGTIYIEQVSGDKMHNGYLYVDNNGNNYNEAGLVEADYTFGGVSLTRYGHLDVLGEGSGCSNDQYLTEAECSSASEIWDGGGELTVSEPDGLVGDSTMPDLTVYGTFNGPDIFSIDGVDVGLRGEVELGEDTGNSDIIVGENQPSGLTLYANTWAHNDEYQYEFGDITVGDFGVVTLVSNDNGDSDWVDDYGVEVNLTNLTVSDDGIITADGWGYRGGYHSTHKGPGGGESSSRDGGAHGGYGGNNSDEPYGDIYEPALLGSMGGCCDGTTSSSVGGHGGGSIKLNIENSLELDGEITADGEDGNDIGNCGSGGGSGGSIQIYTNIISGSGTVSADGGSGSDAILSMRGYPGSGGRISIYYQDDQSSILSTLGTNSSKITAFGGRRMWGDPYYGGPGTIYVENSEENDSRFGDLFIDNNDVGSGRKGHKFLAEDYTFNNFYVGENVEIRLDSDVDENRGANFVLKGDFILDEGSLFDSSGLGHNSGLGEGAGHHGGGEGSIGSGGGGGAHGGSGGAGSDDGVNGASEGGSSGYDSSVKPIKLGSGGGDSGTGAAGGQGGGAVSIISDGDITINGTIDVSGDDGDFVDGSGGGGGAGGSIHIRGCNIYITETAVLNAEGGDGGTDGTPGAVEGGGGGGGIIVIQNECSDIEIDPLSTRDVSGGAGFQTGGVGLFGQYGAPNVNAGNQFTEEDIEIEVGGSIDKRKVKIKIKVRDPDTVDSLKPEIEILKAGEGEGFTETNILEGSPVSWNGGEDMNLETLVDNETAENGEEGVSMLGITADNLEYGEDYKWRARVVDSQGVRSDWMDFGNNDDGADFVIAQAPVCGDGVIDWNEECDSGSLDDETCETRGYTGGDLACTDSCTFDEIDCWVCGNGEIEEGNDEQCDGEDLGEWSCADFDNFDEGDLVCDDACQFDTSSCRVVESCGDGEVQAGEQCDDGNTEDGDGCSAECLIESFVTDDEEEDDDGSVCGNGVVEDGEQCDGEVGEKTCKDFGEFTGGDLVCSEDCEYDTSDCTKEAVCGDGVVQPGEQCDGGVGDKTCSDFEGYRGGRLSCNDSCQFSMANCVGQNEPLFGISIPFVNYLTDNPGVMILFEAVLLLMSLGSIGALSVHRAYTGALRVYFFVLSLFGIRAKGEPWGRVYDSKTKIPISRAVVRLYSEDGELMSTAVTDENGVFNFEAEPGKYKLEVRCPNNIFPSKIVKGSTDGTKKNIYRGGVYEIKSDEKVVKVNIPIDPEDMSGGVTETLRSLWSMLKSILVVINPILLVLGAFIAFNVYVQIGGWINLVSGIINVIFLAWHLYMNWRERIRWGVVVNLDGKRLSGVKVGLYEKKYGKLIEEQITDEKGRFRFIVVGGEYLMKPVGSGYVIDERMYRSGYPVGRKTDEDIVITGRVRLRSTE